MDAKHLMSSYYQYLMDFNIVISLKSDGAKEQRNIEEKPVAIIGQEYLYFCSFCSPHQWVKMTEKL